MTSEILLETMMIEIDVVRSSEIHYFIDNLQHLIKMYIRGQKEDPAYDL
jgi:hypothetical protein